MVQCDKCEVWQHCRCMGLEQPDIPDQYYCEQCKPEHHKLTKLANGKSKRQYSANHHTMATTTNSTTTTSTTAATNTNTTTATTSSSTAPPAPKKRMTLNSREASMSLEDVLAARNALEMYESNNNANENDKADSPAAPPQETVDDIDSIKSSVKRKRELEIKLPETIDEKPEPPSSTVSSVGHEEIPAALMKSLEDTSSPEPAPASPVVKAAKQPQQSKRKKETASKRGGGGGGGSVGKRRGNHKSQPRSRTSTPQPTHNDGSSPALASDEESTPNGDNLSTMLFEYFSPQARASSPPAKTRHPHARMSITEMNRRANQILEYISSIQVEMAINPSSIQHSTTTTTTTMNKQVVPEAEDHEDDDNDSLSSASTIPLTSTNTTEEPIVDREKQTSLEIMDMLTRKLIMFQKRFGSRNRALYEEAMMEGEGRITRSREASSNRNMMAH